MNNNDLKLNELCNLSREFNKYNIKFVVIKTLSETPKSIGDLDILIINNLKEAENSLKHLRYTYIPQKEDTDRKSYHKLIDNIPVMIDLHLDTTWGGIKYLNKNDVWKYKTEKTINKTNIPIPSPEYNLLITAAHAMRENKITLYDVIHIVQLFKKTHINIEFVRDIAKQNNWLIQFQYFISITNEIYHTLYNEINEILMKNSTSDFELLNSKYLKIKMRDVTVKLPFHFSFFTSLKLKLYKVFSDLIHFGLKGAIHDIKCYYPDISEFMRRNYKKEK